MNSTESLVWFKSILVGLVTTVMGERVLYCWTNQNIFYFPHDLTVNEVKITIADLSIKKSENKEHVPQQQGSSHFKNKKE